MYIFHTFQLFQSAKLYQPIIERVELVDLFHIS